MGTEKDGNNNNTDSKSEKNSTNVMKFAVILALLSFLFMAFFFLQTPEKNPYQIKFANETLNFRANLEKAKLVSVYPDGQAIKEAILSKDVEKIKISYAPETEFNKFYLADSFEIAYKLTILFKYYYGISGYVYGDRQGENCLSFEETQKTICIISEPVPSLEQINASSSEPVIFLSASNETSVILKDNIIYIKGKDFSETGRKYTDLDLATDKFLMLLINQQ